MDEVPICQERDCAKPLKASGNHMLRSVNLPARPPTDRPATDQIKKRLQFKAFERSVSPVSPPEVSQGRKEESKIPDGKEPAKIKIKRGLIKLSPSPPPESHRQLVIKLNNKREKSP